MGRWNDGRWKGEILRGLVWDEMGVVMLGVVGSGGGVGGGDVDVVRVGKVREGGGGRDVEERGIGRGVGVV